MKKLHTLVALAALVAIAAAAGAAHSLAPVFVLALVFIFLVLSARFESFVDPLVIGADARVVGADGSHAAAR